MKDKEPVTEDWLLSQGFARTLSDMGGRYSDHFEIKARHGILNIWQFNGGPWLFNDADWHRMETLGEIRSLCNALGVELKENQQ